MSDRQIDFVLITEQFAAPIELKNYRRPVLAIVVAGLCGSVLTAGTTPAVAATADAAA